MNMILLKKTIEILHFLWHPRNLIYYIVSPQGMRYCHLFTGFNPGTQ